MNWKKTITISIKVIVIALAYWFLIKKLSDFENWSELKLTITQNPWRFFRYALPVLSLTLVNLSLRALIWKYLVSNIQVIGFKRAFRAILLGITGGSVTPAKLGDWAGKAVVLNPEYRKKGFFIAAFGHLIQNLTMIIPGIIALYFYSIRFTGLTEILSKLSFNLLWAFEVGLIIFTLIIPFVAPYIKHRIIPQRINGLLQIINAYSYKSYYSIVLLNMVKNSFIFVQLYILLHLFGVDMSISNALIIIPTFYLSLSFVPGIIFADLGVIGALGVMVIGAVYPNLGAVFLATMSIWIANIGTPLLAGSVLIAIYKNKEGKKSSTL